MTLMLFWTGYTLCCLFVGFTLRDGSLGDHLWLLALGLLTMAYSILRKEP